MSSNTPEGKVKRKISALLKKLGVWYTTPAQRGFSKPGVPDYLCLYRGQFFSIEAKAGSGKPTAHQEREMADIREHGGIPLVINEDNIDLIKDVVGLMNVYADLIAGYLKQQEKEQCSESTRSKNVSDVN